MMLLRDLKLHFDEGSTVAVEDRPLPLDVASEIDWENATPPRSFYEFRTIRARVEQSCIDVPLPLG